MDYQELKSYRDVFEKELTDNILPYWEKYAVDRERDGFHGAVDLKNRPVLTANRSCVLNARILWTFSAAAIRYGEKDYSEMANRAYRVLMDHFFDREHGGFFMEVTPQGLVSKDVKHTYMQAFAVYALCKYFQLNARPEVFETIVNTYFIIEEKIKDPLLQGYGEAFTRSWMVLSENRLADHNEPRTMNTHLHLLESYTALLAIWPDSKVNKRLRELINLFLNNIIRPSGQLGIFFDEQFVEAEISKGTCSFGHEIEASWLLLEAAETLGDLTLINRTKRACVQILDSVERVGLDKDGGLFLESTRYGSHLRTNKHWWPQAESLVGFMNGFEMTGRDDYWEKVKLVWDFIDRHVIDHAGGEWFTKVNRLGEPFLTEPVDDPSPFYRNDWKVDPWKCPYHNGRACLEMIKRIDRILPLQTTQAH